MTAFSAVLADRKNIKNPHLGEDDQVPFRLLVLLSHPIQYFSPLFRILHKESKISLVVWYGERGPLRGIKDEEFGRKVDWGVDLLGGYENRFFSNFSLRRRLGTHFFGVINPFMLVKLIRYKPDAIVIHGWAYATYVLVWIMACLLRVPVWLRTDNPWCQERLKTGRLQKLKRYVLREIAFPSVTKFLAVGTENAEWYRQLGVTDERIQLVPHSVDHGPPTDLQNQAREIKEILGIPPNELVFLFVGKLIDKKRPGDLLRAFEGCSSGHLVFVGDGELRCTLQRLVRENQRTRVHFTGFADQKTLHGYYSAADVLILPSGMGETWGLVVNEALIFGLAVIVSDLCGCAADLVEEGGNGFTFETGNVAELRERMEWIIANKEQLPTFSAASRRISRGFDIRRTASALIESIPRDTA
jgi:glycosyltransferase involved in cell wall biosynthesis